MGYLQEWLGGLWTAWGLALVLLGELFALRCNVVCNLLLMVGGWAAFGLCCNLLLLLWSACISLTSNALTRGKEAPRKFRYWFLYGGRKHSSH